MVLLAWLVAQVSSLALPLPPPSFLGIMCEFLATSAGTDMHSLFFPLRKSCPQERFKDLR